MKARPFHSLPEWSRTLFGAVPEAREIRVVCVLVICICVLLGALSIAFGARGQTFLGHRMGADFAAWYVVGKIQNEHPGNSIYDAMLQHRLQHEIRPPLPAGDSLVYANAPFLALLFRPFARLPYMWAWIAWLVFSAALFLAGLAAIWPAGKEFAAVSGTVFLLCLSFVPFILECWLGGQLSTIAFFALALCVRWDRMDRPFASGMSLSLCAYKPTLLILALPMLAAGRRFRTLLGFSAGAAILAVISLAALGYPECVAWAGTLMTYGRFASGEQVILQSDKYVDLNSFVRLLFRGPSYVGLVLCLIVMLLALARLGRAWLRSRPGGGPDSDLLWAATIAFTLVVNVYVPVYDATLVVLSGVLMAGVLYGGKRKPEIRALHVLILCLYAASWFTQALATLLGFQALTLALAATAMAALRFRED